VPDPATVLADLHAFIDHVGDRGVPLTDTGRLRIADVRGINARFAVPEELDHELGPHTYRVRSEDEAWRVHLLRLVGQAAGLLDARRGRLHRVARAGAFGRLDAEDAVRELFIAWWWKGAWDLLRGIEGVPHLALIRDRGATASALLGLGTTSHALEALGAKMRQALAPAASPSTSLALSDEAWGYVTWDLCLEPLAAFGGARPTRTVEELNGHPFETLASIGVTETGVALLRAALEARPAAPPRIRRGMRGAAPPPRAGDVDEDDIALMIEAERRERILRDHPEYRDAIDRGVQRVGEVNPRAHIVLHETVDAQLAGNEPPEVRAAYERLVTAGHEPHSVLHAIAEALGREVWAAQRDRRPFDNARYRARLAALRATDCDDAEAAEELPPATMPPADREKLRGLPRSVRAWEGDLTDLPVEIADRGAPLCAIWTDATDGSVRSLVPDLDAEPGSLALAAFVDAALRPKAGRPELPARVRVHPELATALSFALAGVGVALETAEELPNVHAALDALADYLARPQPPRRRRRKRRRR